jgi:predicted phosphodiesterase
MGKPISENSKIIAGYLDKYPSLPSLTLAKKIYKDNPTCFVDLENVRSIIRYLRGKSGKTSRSKGNVAHLNDKIIYELPESHAESFEPVFISQSKTLIISDLHFPYQDNKSITHALKYGQEHGANCILINGDLIDFALISRHEKNWRHRSVAEEFEAVRMFLKTLRKAFPKARIIFKHGNHDERWEKWLFLKAPEIFDCADFQLEVLLRFGELKIETVKDKRPIKIGKLTVLHGHELPGMGGVNPARATFTKTLASVLVGHYHRTSEHTEPTMLGDVINVHSMGCLCGMNPLFMPINKWNNGFAFCELDINTGEYELHNLKIIKGKVY